MKKFETEKLGVRVSHLYKYKAASFFSCKMQPIYNVICLFLGYLYLIFHGKTVRVKSVVKLQDDFVTSNE